MDPTARIPGHVYWCCSHRGFNEVYDPNNGGHYPRLDDDTLCRNCVVWEELCDQWIMIGGPNCASVRCQLRKDHKCSHLVDDLNGQRFAWIREEPAVEDVYEMGSSAPIGTVATPGGIALREVAAGMPRAPQR